MSEERESMTYEGSGVSYEAMDPFKRAAQMAARGTAEALKRLGVEELEWSRGESVYLQRWPGGLIVGHVEEGLGTKNLVADAILELALQGKIAEEMSHLLGRTFYDRVAQCTVAMIVNDMITLGVLPTSTAMHLAVGESEWFDNKQRYEELLAGWRKACILARCVFGGGETPTLKGLIVPGTTVLAGSAVGFTTEKNLIRSNIQAGDAIVVIESSGIHANGLTLARKIAERHPDGYLARLSDGRTYGEALLDPTRIYVGLIEDCQKAGVDIHYAVNITGHGWRKLMRDPRPFTYVVENIPTPHPVFDFIQEHGNVTDEEMYGNYNMGAGFALFVPALQFEKVANIAQELDFVAMRAGRIEEGEKRVVIKPKDLVYEGETLTVR